MPANRELPNASTRRTEMKRWEDTSSFLAKSWLLALFIYFLTVSATVSKRRLRQIVKNSVKWSLSVFLFYLSPESFGSLKRGLLNYSPDIKPAKKKKKIFFCLLSQREPRDQQWKRDASLAPAESLKSAWYFFLVSRSVFPSGLSAEWGLDANQLKQIKG